MKPIYVVFFIAMLCNFQGQAQKIYVEVDFEGEFYGCGSFYIPYLSMDINDSEDNRIAGFGTLSWTAQTFAKTIIGEVDLATNFTGSIDIDADFGFSSTWSYPFCSSYRDLHFKRSIQYLGSTCTDYPYSESATDYSVNATVRFYKGPSAPTVSAITCNSNSVTLTATDALTTSTIDWQVSEDGYYWTTFRTTSSKTITTNVDELQRPTFTSSKYDNRFVRVIAAAGACGGKRAGSSTAAIRFYASPPTSVAYTGIPPTCHDGEDGKLNLNITSSLPAINDFVITMYKGTYPNGTIVKQDDIVDKFTYTISGLLSNTAYWVRVQNNSTTGTYGSCAYDIKSITPLANPDPVTVTFKPSDYNGSPIKCKGGNDGTLNVNPSGGTNIYNEFVWLPNVSTSNTANNLTAQTYTVKVKDSNGCWSADYSKTLTEPAKVVTTLTSTGGKGGYDVSCWNKTDGAINTLTTGGVGSYTYLWSNNKATQNISSISTGKYTVNVTDANGCADTKYITLTAPTPIDFNIGQISGLTCAGDQTASLEAQGIVNTIGAVNYLWSSGEITPGVTDKGAGNYSLTVSDAQGCSTLKQTAVVAPPAHTVSIAAQSNFNGSAIKCFGESNGEIVAVVKDANNNVVPANYYTWFKDNSNYEQGATKKIISNLSKGQYKVEITYNTECKTQSSLLSLNEPAAVAVNVVTTTSYNGLPISCSGRFDANLKANASGGTGGAISYTYKWNTLGTTATLTGVGAGNYSATVTDKNGCKGSGTLLVQNPNAVEGKILSFSDYSGYGVSCNGSNNGSITAGGEGGTGTYSYAWSNSKATSVISALVAGDYTVTVADNNGCTATPITHKVTTPNPLTVQVNNKQNVLCYNGSDGFIVLKPTGGAGTYEYSKNNTIWQSSSKIDALAMGSYKLYVKDGNGCSNFVNESLTQPTQIQISFKNIEPAFCSDPVGKATSVVIGGVANYKYEWKKEAQSQVAGTGITLVNASAGIYRLFIKDSNNCPAENTVAISSTDGAKSSYSAVDANCFDSSDGIAQIIILSGNGPFSIAWPDGQTSLQRTNLKRDTYNVLITDVHDCTVIQPVEIKSPAALGLNVKSETKPTCNTFCNGQLALEAFGGVGNYVYEWNNKIGATQIQLCAGTYPVKLKDGNNCVLNQSIELTQPEAISVALLNETSPTCKDDCDGALEITATGGNGNYQYVWDIGGNTTVKNNLCHGNYKIDVTDGKGCTGGGYVTLNNTLPPALDLGGGVVVCAGREYTLDAGTSWASIKWKGSNGLSSDEQKIVVMEPGQYWLDVINSQGCVAQDTFLLATSTDLLKANLLLSSEAIVGDTVIMIDVSWPMPENVEWEYPQDMQMLADNGDIVYGQFDTPGTYEISLTAHLGECLDKTYKSITILEDEGDDAIGGRLGHEDFVKEFRLHPNPNDGSFDVSVSLIEESPIVISVWSSVVPKMIRKITDQGRKLYVKHIDLRPLSTGSYVLRLDHAKGNAYIRFVVE